MSSIQRTERDIGGVHGCRAAIPGEEPARRLGQPSNEESKRIEDPTPHLGAGVHGRDRERALEVPLDPRLSFFDDPSIGDLHQDLEVCEREGIEVEAADEQA